MDRNAPASPPPRRPLATPAHARSRVPPSALAADVAGYSRLVAADEEGTRATLKAGRGATVDLVAAHGGRFFGATGDRGVAEFASVAQAARAAAVIRRAPHRRNADLAPDRWFAFRIGLSLGDGRAGAARLRASAHATFVLACGGGQLG